MTRGLLVGLAVLLAATVSPGRAADNVARGRGYTLSPTPNYSLCTDDGDATDLTDGRRAPARFGCRA